MRRYALRAWLLCWLILVWILLWGDVSVANVVSGVAIALAISTAASWMPLCPSMPRARGEAATQRAGLRSPGVDD